ncbi:probable aminoacyl tRNA synthase complex-interacting multifunctional protein 2 isoform X1 [Diabrotica virgifera virgifera]|uniref:Probable aminoacyl tRNA synthase complex-interacting multifunctional protein 2 isoform X1 n=1 Tax=Diabrotica virgifera virgifera TaxID=50390 RepID=A0A6P7FCU0_DIAVI|nr:probable aminoacyl tRNA synthase complex-interacting multifunctional protein 2 isoform X1 [Diabrotica virgifera virgifera]
MNGPIKMYRTRQIIHHDQKIDKPKCMYALKNIYSKDSQDMVDESTDHVSRTNEKSTIFDQVKQFLKNNHQIPGMADLEAKQEEVLKQLADLKKQILSIKLDLKINANSVGTNKTCPSISAEKLNALPDLVVNASPTNPPYSLLIIQKLLHDIVELKVTSHIHSSVPTLNENAKQLGDSLASYVPKRGVPSVNIKLIWKNVGIDTELIVSHVPIFGEVNLLRYLTRVISSPLSYSSDSDSVEIDSILDTCYLLLRAKTKTEKAGHIATLNKSLGKSQWLAGRSRHSLGDLAAYSALKQVTSGSEINANMTKWYQRCETVV